MITFITDKDKNNSPLEDDTPEIGVTSKGQPVEKIIEDAEAANEAEKAETRALQTENLQKALALPCDLLILDEACAACRLGLVDETMLKKAVLQKPAQREVVLTGREPADWMLAAADYCTEMQCRRHPYEKGIAAREGVEY